ncbi:MAG TPA: hypothetical protein PK297_11330 [Spirochaetota bacterium]|nr:hypothetical protein [Spirochaetota bacterium]
MRAAWLFMLLYPLATIFQGFDVTDFGFLAVKYRDILQSGGGVWPITSFYLTEVLAGGWHALAGSAGVVSFKLLFVLLVWCTQGIAWIALKGIVAPRILVPGLVLATLAITPEMQWVNYNNTSALGFALAGLFLIRAVLRGKPADFFLAALAQTVTVFFRLPNLVGLLLLLVPLAYVMYTSGLAMAVRRAGMVLGGFMSGLFVVAGLICSLGHGQEFVTGMQAVFGGSPGESHEVGYLLKRNLADATKVAGVMLFMYALTWLLSRVRFARGKWRMLLSGIMIAACIHISMYLIELEIGKTIITWSLYFLGVCVFLGVEVLRHLPGRFLDRREGWLLVIVFGIAFLVPQGSDRGLWNSVYGLWLAFPYVLHLVFGMGAKSYLDSRKRHALFAVIVVPCAGLAVLFAATFVYRDLPDRTGLVYTLHGERLKGVLTSEARARVWNELTLRLDAYELEGRPLLAYPGIPMLVYATGSLPYLGISWPSLLPVEGQEKAFAWARKRYPEYPLVVRALVPTTGRYWPDSEPGLRTVSRGQDRRRRLDDLTRAMMQAGRYAKVWHNEVFEIWEPDGYAHKRTGQSVFR